MKKFSINLISIIILLFAFSSIIFANSAIILPKEKEKLTQMMNYYTEIGDFEAQWLKTLQLSNGALAYSSIENDSSSVVPYFSSIAAFALLKEGFHEESKNYLIWHLEHINTTNDINNLTGTIYDYTITSENGQVISEVSKNSYDSVDSYAAIFLILLDEYLSETKDIKFIEKYETQINLIINAMESTIDEDGLSYVKPDYPIKFLMDNVEVYKALDSTINLLKNYTSYRPNKDGVYSTITRLEKHRNLMKESIETKLWNEGENRYEIGIDAKGEPLPFKRLTNLYPDSIVQIYPIVFGVIDPNSQKAKYLYENFSQNISWDTMNYFINSSNHFYWSVTSYAGALMEDEVRVKRYIEMYKAITDKNLRQYPLYNGDCAWALLTSNHMEDLYKRKLEKINFFTIK